MHKRVIEWGFMAVRNLLNTILGFAILYGLVVCALHVDTANARQDSPLPKSSHSVELGDERIIARSVLFGNPERTNVQISPDGNYLSWVEPSNGVMNIWVSRLDQRDKPYSITNDQGRGIHSYLWSYKQNTLLYMRDTGGDENFHLYSVNVISGKALDLTPYENVTVGEVISTSYKNPASIVIGMNDRDLAWHDLYLVELDSGRRTLLEKNVDKVSRYMVDSEFKVRLATRSSVDGGEDVLRRREDGTWHEFDRIPFEDHLSTSYLSFTSDGSAITMLESRGRNTSALYSRDMSTGSKTLMFEDSRADVSNFMFDPRTGVLQAAASTYLYEEWKTLDGSLSSDLKNLREELGVGTIEVGSRTQDDMIWIVTYDAPESPTAYYLYNRAKDGEISRIFSSRPQLDELRLQPQWPQAIKSRDGLTLISYLTLPLNADPDAAGIPDQVSPLVLLVHGGPWVRDRYGFNNYVQWLANRGYAVLQVNYRGSTGFGKDFVNRANNEWAGKMHDDLIDSVHWAVEKGITTKEQVAIMGGSYGGYATLVGMTFTPDIFKCGVSIVGPSSLVTMLSSFPAYWETGMAQWYRRVGDPRTTKGKRFLISRSPLTRAADIKNPVLIGQGANDPRIKQAESDQIVSVMKSKKIPVTYVVFPDEGHGFRRAENNVAFYAVAESFLGKCLGGRVEPIGADLSGSSITVPAGADEVPGLADSLRSHSQVVRD